MKWPGNIDPCKEYLCARSTKKLEIILHRLLIARDSQSTINRDLSAILFSGLVLRE